ATAAPDPRVGQVARGHRKARLADEVGLSTLSARCVELFEQLPGAALVAAVRPRCETEKGYSPRWRPTSPPPFRNDGGDGGHLPWLARRNMSTLTRRRSGRAAHALSSRRGARRSAGSRGARVAPSSSAGVRYLPRRD